MKKLKTEKQFHQKKKGSKIILFIIAIFAVLSVLRIFVANRLVDYATRLQALEQKEAQLRAENAILNLKYSRLSSLSYMKEQALSAGFTENPRLVFVQPGRTVAVKTP